MTSAEAGLQRISQLDDDDINAPITLKNDLWCGCGTIFLGINVISVWTLFVSFIFIIVGVIGSIGYKMEQSTLSTNAKTTYRVLIGLLLIPGITRIISAIFGFFLPPKLEKLMKLDNAFVRPDDYNSYELGINIWTWSILWVPILTECLLAAGIIGYLVIVTEGNSAWDSKQDTVSNFVFVSVLTIAVFSVPITDIILCYIFYTVFREFVETRFMNILGICGCFSMWNYKHQQEITLRENALTPPLILDEQEISK